VKVRKNRAKKVDQKNSGNKVGEKNKRERGLIGKKADTHMAKNGSKMSLCADKEKSYIQE